MRVERRFTEAGKSPYDGLTFRAATSIIRNPDGSVVFDLDGFMVPSEWSQVACDVLAQKYFRKAGVPQRLQPVPEADVPEWLWRRVPDEAALADIPAADRSAGETDTRQVFERRRAAWWTWVPVSSIGPGSSNTSIMRG